MKDNLFHLFQELPEIEAPTDFTKKVLLKCRRQVFKPIFLGMGLGVTIILVIFGGYNFWIEAQNGLLTYLQIIPLDLPVLFSHLSSYFLAVWESLPLFYLLLSLLSVTFGVFLMIKIAKLLEEQSPFSLKKGGVYG